MVRNVKTNRNKILNFHKKRFIVYHGWTPTGVQTCTVILSCFQYYCQSHKSCRFTLKIKLVGIKIIRGVNQSAEFYSRCSYELQMTTLPVKSVCAKFRFAHFSDSSSRRDFPGWELSSSTKMFSAGLLALVACPLLFASGPQTFPSCTLLLPLPLYVDALVPTTSAS